MKLFCKHKFKLIHDIDVYDGGKRPIYKKLVFMCEHCGKIKKVKV